MANIRSSVVVGSPFVVFAKHGAALLAQAQVVAVRNAILLGVGEADDTSVGGF